MGAPALCKCVFEEKERSRQPCCRYSSVEDQASVSFRSDRAIHSVGPREEGTGGRGSGANMRACVRGRRKRDGRVLMHCFS